MKKIILIVVGKSKEESFAKEEKEYLKRLRNIQLEIVELKAQATKDKNDSCVIEKIKSYSNKAKPITVLLDERGKQHSSADFSEWLYSKLECSSSAPLIFVIGGAEGHGEEIKQFTKETLTLSKMTLPHRLARVVFIEQIYRAETIQLQHPYHK